MMNNKFQNWLFAAIIGFALSACTNPVYVKVMRSAPLDVPQHIKKIAVANRAAAAKDNKTENIIEGILTGEFIEQDKRASIDAVLGLIDGIQKTPRFTSVQVNKVLKGTGTSRMPDPLPWSEVEKLCKESESDALLVLEVFDSDTRINMNTRLVKKTVQGAPIDVTEHIANARVVITSGWRLYDPVTKSLIDDVKREDFREFSGVGANPVIASASLPAKERTLKETGYVAGENYAYRISPMWTTVQRMYYIKGHPKLKTAKWMARAGNWNEAAAIWNKVAESSTSAKARKRAAYNMILACEIEGKLDLAEVWAKKAISYGCRPAAEYSRIIKQRMREEQRVNQQLGEGN